MPEPEFFIDRSLGRRQVPELLRADDWTLVTLAEQYGVPADEGVSDVEWLQLAGERGWIVLMKDERIRYRPSERAALLTHRVRAFCLTSGNLTGQQMAELLIHHRSEIWDLADGRDPALFAVSRTGVRQIDLSD
jgi:PIN like domain